VITLLATLGAMIVVTHTVRYLAGLLGERWGGLLIGLPLSTALTLLYCLWEHGPDYAARAAGSGLLGLGATVAFAVATACCLSRSRLLVLSVAAGAATYVLAALLVRGTGDWQPVIRLLLALGLIAAGHRIARGLSGEGQSRRPLSRGWKLFLRTAIPVVCLTAILLLARNAEASWAGLFGTFPCTVLAVLLVTNLEAGPGASVELLRTYPLGNCSTLAFLAAFAHLTPSLGPVAGYGVGYLAAGCVLVALGQSGRAAKKTGDSSEPVTSESRPVGVVLIPARPLAA
jgi:hypothetical protein